MTWIVSYNGIDHEYPSYELAFAKFLAAKAKGLKPTIRRKDY